jgi:hypothetical protein
VRSLILLLMIALLPMRMWAAEGMAIKMAAQGQQSSATAAHGPGGESMHMPMESMDDCPMAEAMSKGSASDESKGSAASCLTCQLCATLAGLPVAFHCAAAAPNPPLRAVSARFDSADPVREHKPPIS